MDTPPPTDRQPPIRLPRRSPLILNQRRSRPNTAPAPPANRAAAARPYWVHWTYTEAEWRAWTEREWAYARWDYNRTRLILWTVLGILLLAAWTFVAWSIGFRAIQWAILGFILLALVGSGLLIWLARRDNRQNEAEDLYQFRHGSPREAAIGPWWIWQEGEAQPLLRTPTSRLHVWISTTTPLHLIFAIEESAIPINGLGTRLINVLIPQGREAEAAALVARFQREIINNPAAFAHRPAQEPPPPTAIPAGTRHLPPLPTLPNDSDTRHLPVTPPPSDA